MRVKLAYNRRVGGEVHQLAVTSVAATFSAHRKKLDKLRVVVADAIFCYGVNRDTEPKDIWRSAAAHELSGQYGLKILLNWLATKCGFPIYACGINPRSQADFEPLATWGQLAGRYPLNAPEDILFLGTGGGAARKEAWAAVFRFLDENFEPRLELIGDFYMRLLSDRERGEFYTAPEVVDHCLRGSLDDNKTGRGGVRFLDPACGTGNFLLGALRELRARGWSHDSLVQFARDGLYGCDIDPRAVSLAQLCIVLALREPSLIENLSKHIVVRDAVFSVDVLRALKPTIVVTNPPYVSFGSRGQGRAHASWTEFVRSAFAESSEYKIRLHSVFQQLGLTIADDGGTVIMLVPDAFLSGAYYKKLREYISRNAHIEALTELPESTFPDAVAGKWCIARYRKGVELGEGTSVARGVEAPYLVPEADLIDRTDKFRFNLIFNHEDLVIARSVRSSGTRLREVLRGHTGMRSRNGQKSIIAEESRGDFWKRGITSGACLIPYRVNYEGKWLNTDPSGLFAGGFDREVIENPKILVRQTADRIISAVDQKHLYHLNNVHSFSGRHLAVEELELLTGLLNSSLWLFLYQMRSRERKRALAQIDIEMIESMPMPSDWRADGEIARLVRRISAESTRKFSELQREIDARVYELYGLPSTSIEYIERTLRDQGYIAAPLPVAANDRTCYIH